MRGLHHSGRCTPHTGLNRQSTGELYSTMYTSKPTPGISRRSSPRPSRPARTDYAQLSASTSPFSSCYGPFKEMGLVVQVTWNGKKCFYLPALYLNNDSAIAAGREIYGSPKKLAEVTTFESNETFTATCRRSGVDFLTITTKITGPGKESDFVPVFPCYKPEDDPLDRRTMAGSQTDHLLRRGQPRHTLYVPVCRNRRA